MVTNHLQPAIYVTSLAAVEVLRARDGGQDIIDSVDVTCGLSLGEYTALAFAGAFRYSILSSCLNKTHWLICSICKKSKSFQWHISY